MEISTLKKTIFFADDDQDDRMIYKLAFGEVNAFERFDLKFATDGTDLLAKIGTGKALPAMVFLDLNMPRMGGKECLIALRKLATPIELPVIIFSTSEDERDVEDTYALKANSYYQKPQSFQAVADTLKMCLEKIETGWSEVSRAHFFVGAVR